MADGDFYADKTPQLVHRAQRTPTIAALRTALQTFSGTTYTNAVLQSMTKQDMTYAARQNGLTVAGL